MRSAHGPWRAATAAPGAARSTRHCTSDGCRRGVRHSHNHDMRPRLGGAAPRRHGAAGFAISLHLGFTAPVIMLCRMPSISWGSSMSSLSSTSPPTFDHQRCRHLVPLLAFALLLFLKLNADQLSDLVHVIVVVAAFLLVAVVEANPRVFRLWFRRTIIPWPAGFGFGSGERAATPGRHSFSIGPLDWAITGQRKFAN